jgi:hypothetical protein
MACRDTLPAHLPTEKRPAARKARRRRERGAALVEAAFMLPMFVILWYGSLYVHSLGSTYIKVNTSARQDAWQTAMSNCGVRFSSNSEVLPASLGGVVTLPDTGGDGATASAIAAALKSGNIIGALAGFVNTFTAEISVLFPNPNGASFVSTAGVSWRVPNLYDHTGAGERNTTVSGAATVVCNEAPINGSILGVAVGLVNLILSIVQTF